MNGRSFHRLKAVRRKLSQDAFILALVGVAALTGREVFADAKFLRAAEPIPNSYIVVLANKNAGKSEVKSQALSLAKSQGGRAWGLLVQGIKGFGFRGTEAAAYALSRNPNVAWVEEDGIVHLAWYDDGDTIVVPGPQINGGESCSTQGSTTVCTYSPVTTSQITKCTPSSGWNCDDDYWHLDRIDQSTPISVGNRSYGFTSNGAGVRVYVLDYGVRGNHAELAGKVEAGANMMVDPDLGDNPNVPNCTYNGTPCEDVYPLDFAPADNPCYGQSLSVNTSHGTAVASVIAGAHVGVARGANIVPVKVGVCNGGISKLAVARGLDWIIGDVVGHAPQRAVVSISLRFVLASPEYNQATLCETDQDIDGDGIPDNTSADYTNCVGAIEHNIIEVIKKNVPVVVAAGNDYHDVDLDGMSRLGYGGSYGSAQYRTITAGGTMYNISAGQYSDAIWTCNAFRDANPPYSSCTRNVGSNYGSAVSIFAPAWTVKVADGNTITGYRPPGILSSGTSFAAPGVAGAIARILQKNPSYTVDDVWGKLRGDADAHGTGNPDFDPSSVVNRRLLYIDVTD